MVQEIEQRQFFADLSPFVRYLPFSSLKFRRLSVPKTLTSYFCEQPNLSLNMTILNY